MDLCSKPANIKSKIAEKGKLVVAYSGGVDSSLQRNGYLASFC
jgi:PP-loop superfamily ATP-utilizing enzyme